MVENANNLPDKLKQEYTEIYAEIQQIINGTETYDTIVRKAIDDFKSQD